MKNTFKKVLVISLVLLTVLTLFVACNSENDKVLSNSKNPMAKRDPNNPEDSLRITKDYTLNDDFNIETVLMTLTNSESLNNVFYDYKTEDFEINGISYIEETQTSIQNVSIMRNQIKNNLTHIQGSTNTLNP